MADTAHTFGKPARFRSSSEHVVDKRHVVMGADGRQAAGDSTEAGDGIVPVLVRQPKMTGDGAPVWRHHDIVVPLASELEIPVRQTADSNRPFQYSPQVGSAARLVNPIGDDLQNSLQQRRHVARIINTIFFTLT